LPVFVDFVRCVCGEEPDEFVLGEWQGEQEWEEGREEMFFTPMEGSKSGDEGREKMEGRESKARDDVRDCMAVMPCFEMIILICHNFLHTTLSYLPF